MILLLYRIVFLVLLLVLLGAAFLSYLVNTEWAKKKIQEAASVYAKEQGLILEMQGVEIPHPLYCTIGTLHLEKPGLYCLDVESLKIRLDLLALLQKKLLVHQIHSKKASLHFRYTHTARSLPPIAAEIRRLKIDTLTLCNDELKTSASYQLQARMKTKRFGSKLFAQIKLSGKETPLTSVKLTFQANQKEDFAALDLQLNLTDPQYLCPFTADVLPLTGTCQLSLDGPFNSWKSLFASSPLETPLKGKAVGTINNDQKYRFESLFTLKDTTHLDVQQFAIRSSLLIVDAEGTVSLPFDESCFALRFSLPSLEKLYPPLKGSARGSLYFNNQGATLEGAGSSVQIGPYDFEEMHLKLQALSSHEGWNGSLLVSARSDMLPFSLDTQFFLAQDRSLRLSALEWTSPSGNLSAEALFSHSLWPTSFALKSHFTQLSSLAPLLQRSYLSGALDAELAWQNNHFDIRAKAKNLTLFDAAAEEASLEASESSLMLLVKSGHLGDIALSTLSLESLANHGEYPFTLHTQGVLKEPFELLLKGRGSFSENTLHLHLQELLGYSLKKQLSLKSPFTAHLAKDSLSIKDMHLNIGEGSLFGNIHYCPQEITAEIASYHFPLEFLTIGCKDFTLLGSASIEASMHLTPSNCQASLDVLLEGSEIQHLSETSPLATSGHLSARLDQDIMQVNCLLGSFDFMATLPVHCTLAPLQLTPDLQKNFSARVSLDGSLEEIFHFISTGSHHISGNLHSQLFLSGSLAAPSLYGALEIQNGSYSNYQTETSFHDIAGKIQAENHTLTLSAFSAKDAHDALLNAKGTMQLVSPSLPFEIDADFDKVHILHMQGVRGSGSGHLHLYGNMHEATLQAQIQTDHVEVTLPDHLSLDFPNLPITYENFPSAEEPLVTPSAFLWNYAVDLSAKKGVFVRGRGLSSEWNGELQIGGSSLAPTFAGALHLTKGEFLFSGKAFSLTKGEILFTNQQRTPAYLDLCGTLILPDATISALLKGPLTEPQLCFQSLPYLPTSAILSRILFNKDVSEISPWQAIQLAQTIMTLSGNAGPDFLESIRRGLGVDRLNVISTPSSSGDTISVQVGKYLTRGVMVTLSQSASSSNILLEVELKAGLLLQAETQEEQEGKFTLKWNKNY